MILEPFQYDGVGPFAASVRSSVRPLAVSAEGGRELVPTGSGVLIWHNAKRYLISAYHVLAEYRESPPYISTGRGWLSLPLPFFTLSAIPLGTNAEEVLDLVAMEIPPDRVEQMAGCTFLTGSQVASRSDVLEVTNPPPLLTAFGWPQNKRHFNRALNRTDPDHFSFTGWQASPDMYRKTNKDPNEYVLVDLDPKAVVTSAGERVPKLQKLEGISGGGLFRIPGLHLMGDLAPAQLWGIIIEQDRLNKLLVCVSVPMLLEALASGH